MKGNQKMLTDPQYDAINMAVQERRKERGWTLQQLADKAGVSRQVLNDALYRRSQPGALLKAAVALGVPVPVLDRSRCIRGHVKEGVDIRGYAICRICRAADSRRSRLGKVAA